MSPTYWFSVLILFLNTLYFSNANPEYDPLKIVGGNATKPNDYRYVVGINCNKRECACTGSIIDDMYVVSAAHCFAERLDRPSRIVAGTNNISDYEQPGRIERDVVKIYIPGDYFKDHSANDIAVLMLNESLQLTRNNLTKLRLPALPKNERLTVQRAVLLGFGSTNMTLATNKAGELVEKAHPNSMLHSANVEVAPLRKCYRMIVAKSNICARVIKDDLSTSYGGCDGDSGGPLVYKSDVLLGILIHTPFGCDVRFDYALYTRVRSHVPFIKNAMKDNVIDMIVKHYH